MIKNIIGTRTVIPHPRWGKTPVPPQAAPFGEVPLTPDPALKNAGSFFSFREHRPRVFASDFEAQNPRQSPPSSEVASVESASKMPSEVVNAGAHLFGEQRAFTWGA